MARWEAQRWEPNPDPMLPRRERRGGTFHTYVPDPLVGAAFVADDSLDDLLAQAERAVRALEDGHGADDLSGIARFLLRSEAIASSRIEGIVPTARQVAFAELAEHEPIKTFGDQARLVARNMTVVREATTALAEPAPVTADALVELHRALLADEPRHHGIRTVQNWIGGASWHPIDAEFVPPEPTCVPALLDDLAKYVSGAAHGPIVQAALAHAQFETIHPFTDGNGRVGRALIHTVFARRGLATRAVVPVSLVLATFTARYVEGLSAYRYDGEPGGHEAISRRAAWVATFAEAVLLATEQAARLRADIAELRADWRERAAAQRSSAGRQRQVRSDAVAAQILADLPSAPVLTTSSVVRIHGVSENAAARALGELRDAGILQTRSTGTRARAYVAVDVLDLITSTERRLASTRFDTRAGW